MKRTLVKIIPVLVMATLLSACGTSSSTKTGEEAAPIVEGGVGAAGEGASISGARAGGAWAGNPLENPDSLLYTKVIHFDFDRSDIRPEYRDVVIAHGQYLAQNPNVTVTVEGHCDERGSREYNIGLGERRANTVKQLLQAQGAAESQIATISYGEERPLAYGSDESAWAQNRRAVFMY